MRKISLSLTNGNPEPLVWASIDDPLLAAFVVTGLLIAAIIFVGLAIVGFRFLCLVGACNAFRSC